MGLQQQTSTERVQNARERYVARGVSTPPLVVERAEGARPATLDALEETRPRAEAIGILLRERLTAMAPPGSDVRGLGPMLALELSEQSSEETTRITRAAREQGLVLLSCGIYGNVIRILVPFAIDDAELERGLDILEGCLDG